MLRLEVANDDASVREALVLLAEWRMAPKAGEALKAERWAMSRDDRER